MKKNVREAIEAKRDKRAARDALLNTKSPTFWKYLALQERRKLETKAVR
jgi:hypothetical protein